MSMPIIWLIITVAFLIGEAATTTLISIWFAGGGVIALISALIGAPVWAQIILFAVSSGVILYLTRDLAHKYINNRHQRTNADRVVGMEGIVTEGINNDLAVGQIRVAGQIWTARGSRESVIEQDAPVIVTGIEGVKAMVIRKRTAPDPAPPPEAFDAGEEAETEPQSVSQE